MLLFNLFFFLFRKCPAPIRVDVKSIDDTSNFDEFPNADLCIRKFVYLLFCLLFRILIIMEMVLAICFICIIFKNSFFSAEYKPDIGAAKQQFGDRGEFSNYTYRRFDGLTQNRQFRKKCVRSLNFHEFLMFQF